MFRNDHDHLALLQYTLIFSFQLESVLRYSYLLFYRPSFYIDTKIPPSFQIPVLWHRIFSHSIPPPPLSNDSPWKDLLYLEKLFQYNFFLNKSKFCRRLIFKLYPFRKMHLEFWLYLYQLSICLTVLKVILMMSQS